MGEIVLAKLSKNITVCEQIGDISEKKRVRLKIGKNKEGKVPTTQIVFRTGKQAKSSQDVLDFATKCKEIASSIDLAKAWSLLHKKGHNTSTREILDSIQKTPECPENVAAVHLAVEKDSLYFKELKGQFIVERPDGIERVLSKRRLAEQRNQEKLTLLTLIASGDISTPLSDFQKESLNHLREFAIHGTQYYRAYIAIELLKLITSGNSDQLQRYSFEHLADIGVFNKTEPIELESNHISTKFSDEIYKELTQFKPPGNSNMDLTNIPTFTIDDEDTLDRDDAFSITQNHIWIHISDISSLVREGCEIDKEASSRSSTLYIPDGKVPMLPKSLSEQDGSLTPPDTKICQSLKLNIGANGQLTHGTFEMTKIRINQSLSYSEADDLLENRNHGLFSLFKRVTELTNASKEQRLRNGALFVDRSEMKLTCIQGERIKVEIIDINSPSREMIAELMIIYNGQVAEFCFKNNIPVAYRTQEPPDYEQSTRVVKDPLTWYITSKSLRKAALSMKPKKHFGLGVDKYTQASSPIRRYADLQLQRQLVHFLKTGLAKYSEEEMKCTTNRSEAQAKKLKLIEVSRKRYWFLKYLNDSYLKFAQAPLFQAIALEKGNGERNRFELVNYPYRSRCSLPTTVNPGDLVTVELNGVDLWHKSSQFSYSGST